MNDREILKDLFARAGIKFQEVVIASGEPVESLSLLCRDEPPQPAGAQVLFIFDRHGQLRKLGAVKS